MPLTRDNSNYVRERLLKDLGRDARQVIEDPAIDSPVAKGIRTLLTGADDKFIATSQDFAHHLRKVQTGVNPPGMVLVADCQLDNGDAVLIAKVELERGVQATPRKIDGELTYDMQLLDDLVFGQTSRIFKVGLFSAADISNDLLVGYAIDRQSGGPALAGFFLHEYLGCRYTKRPEVLTKNFMDAAQSWINSKVQDPEKQVRYEVALLAELQSPAPELEPMTFVSKHIDPSDRDSFVSEAVGASGHQKFPKDTRLISVRRMKIETTNGVVVIADPSLIEGEVVNVDADRITIYDSVHRTLGDGRAAAPVPPESNKG